MSAYSEYLLRERKNRAIGAIQASRKLNSDWKYSNRTFYYNVRFEDNDLVYVQDGDIVILVQDALGLTKREIIRLLND